MVDEVVQYNRLAPYIEQRGEMLLGSVFGDPNAVKGADETEEAFQLRKLGRAGIAQQIPGYQFAGFTPEQQQAFGLASQNIGSYAPALQQAMGSAGLAGGAIVLPSHNTLGGLQGGTSSQYYHLTSAQHSGLTNSSGTTLHFHAHNNMSDMQGGTSGEYYHLTSAQYLVLANDIQLKKRIWFN